MFTCRSDKEASSRWYYWKLKPEDVTAGTKLLCSISSISRRFVTEVATLRR